MTLRQIGFILIIVSTLILAAVITFSFTSTNISGTVIDELTGKPVKAEIDIDGRIIDIGSNGKFVVSLMPGDHELVIKAKGFDEKKARTSLTFLTSVDLGEIKLKNSSVITGEIKVNSVFPEMIDKATITFGEKDFAITDNAFEVTGVKPGEQDAVIEAVGYEKFEKKVTIKKGVNQFSAELTLIPEEMLKRWFEKENSKDFDGAHKYVHPDVASFFEKKAYLANRKSAAEAGVGLISLEIGEAKIIPEWNLDVKGFKKTYKDVAEIDVVQVVRVPVTSDGVTKINEIKSEGKVHLVKVDGRWKTFPLPYKL